MQALQNARRKMTIALFLAQSFFSAAMIASFTLMPILAADLSGRDSTAGLPTTIHLLGRAIAAYPIGWLMDRAGRRIGLSAGYGVGALGMAMAVWAIVSSSFLWFLVGAGLFGMGQGGSELGRYVAAEIQTPERRAKAIGWIVSAGTVGAIAGPMLVEPSGQLAERSGLMAQSGPFVLGALLMLAGLTLIWVFLRPDPAAIAVPEESDKAFGPVEKRSIWDLFSNPQVLMALTAMTIGQIVMTFIMVITPLHMDHQNHGTREISLVITAHTLGMFGLAWLTGGLVDRYGRVVMVFIGAILLVLAGILAPISSTVWLLSVALFLLGLGWNFCFVAGSSLLASAVTARDKGRLQGASEVVVALASGAGSLGSGFVFAAGGIQVVGAVALVLVLALLASTSWFSWSRRRTSMEPA